MHRGIPWLTARLAPASRTPTWWSSRLGDPGSNRRPVDVDIRFSTIVVLDDASLAEWLDDEEAVRSFLTCAHFVCEHVDLYSPVAMLPRIRPLDRLRRADLLQLRETLAELFEQRFRPHVVESELRERLDALLATMKSVSLGGATSSELALVRAAARALQARMTRLPRGFWLPGSPLTG